MKVVILNGSPRSAGNTTAAINALSGAIRSNVPTAEIVEIALAFKKQSPCCACDSCKRNGGRCVMQDDTNAILDEVKSADALVFASPVYWWGVSAQLKIALDKLYAIFDILSQQHKKVGVISIGADEVNGVQYDLISRQFGCICEHMGWQMAFFECAAAYQPGDLLKDSAVLARFAEAWRKLVQ